MQNLRSPSGPPIKIRDPTNCLFRTVLRQLRHLVANIFGRKRDTDDRKTTCKVQWVPIAHSPKVLRSLVDKRLKVWLHITTLRIHVFCTGLLCQPSHTWKSPNASQPKFASLIFGAKISKFLAIWPAQLNFVIKGHLACIVISWCCKVP